MIRFIAPKYELTDFLMASMETETVGGEGGHAGGDGGRDDGPNSATGGNAGEAAAGTPAGTAKSNVDDLRGLLRSLPPTMRVSKRSPESSCTVRRPERERRTRRRFTSPLRSIRMSFSLSLRFTARRGGCVAILAKGSGRRSPIDSPTFEAAAAALGAAPWLSEVVDDPEALDSAGIVNAEPNSFAMLMQSGGCGGGVWFGSRALSAPPESLVSPGDADGGCGVPGADTDDGGVGGSCIHKRNTEN